MTKDITKQDFFEALSNYYQLKKKYDDEYTKLKNNILQNKDSSWKEKRRILQKQVRKCVSCNQPGGTIFSSKKDDTTRHLFALCNAKNKCLLNIHFEIKSSYNIENVLSNSKTQLKNYKTKIMKYKNDEIFGYQNSITTVKYFNDLQKEYNEINDAFAYEFNQYMHIMDNNIEKQTLKLKEESFYNIVSSLKNAIKEYKISGNKEVIVELVSDYIKTLEPLNKEILNLKYSYNNVEYDEKYNVYRLVQIFKTIEDLDIFDVQEDFKIISNTIGVRPVRKHNKTLRSYKEKKSVTKKNNVAKLLNEDKYDFEVENEDEDEQEDGNNEKKQSDDENIDKISTKIVKKINNKGDITIEDELLDDSSIEDDEITGEINGTKSDYVFSNGNKKEDIEDIEDKDKIKDETIEDNSDTVSIISDNTDDDYERKPKLKIYDDDISSDSIIPPPPPLESMDETI